MSLEISERCQVLRGWSEGDLFIRKEGEDAAVNNSKQYVNIIEQLQLMSNTLSEFYDTWIYMNTIEYIHDIYDLSNDRCYGWTSSWYIDHHWSMSGPTMSGRWFIAPGIPWPWGFAAKTGLALGGSSRSTRPRPPGFDYLIGAIGAACRSQNDQNAWSLHGVLAWSCDPMAAIEIIIDS